MIVLWDKHFDTNESVREMSPVGGPKLRQFQFVFLFYTLKPQGEAGKRVRFFRSTLAAGRLLRATAHYFSCVSGSFCFR